MAWFQQCGGSVEDKVVKHTQSHCTDCYYWRAARFLSERMIPIKSSWYRPVCINCANQTECGEVVPWGVGGVNNFHLIVSGVGLSILRKRTEQNDTSESFFALLVEDLRDFSDEWCINHHNAFCQIISIIYTISVFIHSFPIPLIHCESWVSWSQS